MESRKNGKKEEKGKETCPNWLRVSTVFNILQVTLLYAAFCRQVLYEIPVLLYSVKFSRKHLQCNPTFGKVAGTGLFQNNFFKEHLCSVHRSGY